MRLLKHPAAWYCRFGGVLLLAAIALVVFSVAAAAQVRVITGIEPAVIQQGETVLLTISGENLPAGTVALEFFPQQIALLDILSASATEVVAQIKVPSLVSPGLYNVLLYNHLGDEVFAEGLLTIASDVITPVFRDYDPKVIAEATEGFALLLTGDSITNEATGHLSMRWLLGQRELTRLTTTFSSGGPGQVLCAVTGDLPGGVMQGRIYLDGTPIYLVEISIESPTGLLVGHSPAQLALDVTPYEISILGADLTAGFANALTVELSSNETVAKARDVTLIDSSNIRAVFSGPLPSGIYSLAVSRLDEQLYSGEVSLIPATDLPDIGAEEVVIPEVIPEDDRGLNGQLGPDETTETPQLPVPVFTIASVAPTVIEPGSKAASLVINGAGLTAQLAERLEMGLWMGADECELLFLGAGHNSLTCLFAPPSGGWRPQSSGTLTISDPERPLADYSTEIMVGQATEIAAPEPDIADETDPDAKEREQEPPLPDENLAPVVWVVDHVNVDTDSDAAGLVVAMSAQTSSWDLSALAGSFNLLPAEPLVQRIFSNITLAGDLAFRKTGDLTVEGRCAGNFVVGDVLVEYAYGENAASAALLQVDAGQPRGVVTAPGVEAIHRDPVSGQLAPGILEWTVDFSPFEIDEPGFIAVVLEPTPVEQADVVAVTAAGPVLAISVNIKAWQDSVALGREIAISLIPSIQVELAGGTEFVLPIRGNEAAAERSIAYAQDECLIDDDGFELLLDVSRVDIQIDQLADVEAESSNLLLSLNLQEFSVIAEPRPALGSHIVCLDFVRDKSTLNDLSYELLMAELLESEGVELTLVWPAHGLSASGELSFVMRENGSTADLLGTLGLNGEQN